MNTLLLGNLHWPDFLREDLDPRSWSEKEKKVKQRYMDCDVKVCFLWNIPFQFLSLLYTFLNFTTPVAKEKEIHSSHVFVQVWHQIPLQRLWAAAGVFWDCGLWWKSLVQWKQNDAHGANIGILREVSWQAWGSFLMGYRGSIGQVPRTGDRSYEWTSHRLSGPVSLWSRGIDMGLQTQSGAGMISWQWYWPLTAEGLISGVRYTLVCIQGPSFIKSG